KPSDRQKPGDIGPPPYHPDTPTARHDWARYYELITALDYRVGELLDELQAAGLEEETIVFFWSDQGCGLPRMKQWIYDSGTHVPLIVRIPKKLRVDGQGKPGTVDDQIISFVDLAPTVLNLAGLPIPSSMQGRAFLGENLGKPRDYAFAARDRMDERYDIIRTVRDKRYRYIRNYMPQLGYSQYIFYSEQMPTARELRRLHNEGKLGPEAELFFRPRKPVEELFDLARDPHEVHDVAGDPRYADVLRRMREAHEKWMIETDDLGLLPEAELNRRAKLLGSERAILRQPGAKATMARVRRVVEACAQGESARAMLLDALDDSDPAVRWWAATGLGYLDASTGRTLESLDKSLGDDSPAVRVAAAKSLCRQGQVNAGLPVLIDAMKAKALPVRLHAILALDEMGPQARPAIAAIRKASLDAKDKYVQRVAKHALAQLDPSTQP
ncbi:MAG: sulfatase-like hydrolase/transferase, partial [Pirellulales bacterium]|nr:sulfatase-like hydrolase/transferase [Pirellulales bacterium]